jgi:hypothetical protein
MAATKQLLIEASKLPISIVILGIGNSDFASLYELDSEKGNYTDELGERPIREMV